MNMREEERNDVWGTILVVRCVSHKSHGQRAWRATVHRITRVGHDLATKPPPPPWTTWSPQHPWAYMQVGGRHKMNTVSTMCERVRSVVVLIVCQGDKEESRSNSVRGSWTRTSCNWWEWSRRSTATKNIRCLDPGMSSWPSRPSYHCWTF